MLLEGSKDYELFVQWLNTNQDGPLSGPMGWPSDAIVSQMCFRVTTKAKIESALNNDKDVMVPYPVLVNQARHVESVWRENLSRTLCTLPTVLVSMAMDYAVPYWRTNTHDGDCLEMVEKVV